jgi:hypothetical protein
MSGTIAYHGSEDGQQGLAGLSGPEDAQAASMAGSTATGTHNPLFVERVVERMDQPEFWDYLYTVTGDEALSRTVIEDNGITTGGEWVELLTCVGRDEALTMLREDFGVTSRVKVAKLLREVTLSSSRMRGDGMNKTDGSPELDPSQSQQDRGSEGTLNLEVEPRTFTEPVGDELKRLAAVKLCDMPKLPGPKSGEYMISSVQLNTFQVGQEIFLSAHSKPLAIGVATLIEKPDTSLQHLYAVLSLGERALDRRCAGHLFQNAPVCLQNVLMEGSNRKHMGDDSMLAMIKAIAGKVNFKSDERTMKLLTQFLVNKKKQVLNPKALASELALFRIEFGVHSRIASVPCAAMYRAAVKHLIGRLCTRNDLLMPLVAPMAHVEAAYPGDLDMFMEQLEKVATDLSIMEFESQPTNPRARTEGVYQVDRSEMLCMNKREGRPCRDGLNCPFKHEGFSGQICTEEKYLETGICAKFNSGCIHKHPWNEEKHGPKTELLAKLKNPAKKAYLHAVNTVTPVEGEFVGAAHAMLRTPDPAGARAGALEKLEKEGYLPAVNTLKPIQGGIVGAVNTTLAAPNPAGTRAEALDRFRAAIGEGDPCAPVDTHLDSQAAGVPEELDTGVPDEQGACRILAKLRPQPEPTRMHLVDQHAILAVIAEEGEDSSDPCDESKSVTNTSSDEAGLEAGVEDALAISEDGSSDAWGDEDGEYDTSPTPTSEDITSSEDSPGYCADRELVVATTQELRRQGWSQSRVDAWLLADHDMAKAVKRMAVGNVSRAAEGVENEPGLKLMFDGGTFDHLWGTDAVQSGMVINIHRVDPVPCRIAKGFMWLDTKGDLVFKDGTVMRDGFVNPHHDMSLVSEGRLALFEGWEFRKNAQGLAFTVLGGPTRVAWRQGVLFYIPGSMLSEHSSCNSVIAQGDNPLFGRDSLFDQEYAMQCSDEEATALWFAQEAFAHSEGMAAYCTEVEQSGQLDTHLGSRVTGGPGSVEPMGIDELDAEGEFHDCEAFKGDFR